MSDHLPECPCANRRDEFHEHDVATMVNGQLGCLACGVDCFCPALRACTVRVQLQSERVGFKAGVRRTKSVVIDEMYRWGIAPSDDAAASILAAIDRLAQGAP